MVIPVQPAATWIMETITICKKDATSMKTLIKSWMLIAAAAMAFTACTKDSVEEDNTLKPVQLTIQAGNPEVSGIDEQGTRTEMQGATPMWSANDQIGVTTTGSSDAPTNHKSFTNDSESSTQTTTFSGSITLPAEGTATMLYAYYPYTSNGISYIADNETFGAKVDLPANQNPTVSSFDGAADMLVAKPVEVTANTTKIENMQFKRVSGVVKVVLQDNTTGNVITGQYVNTLAITSDETQDLPLAGRVVLDFVNGGIGAPYHGQSSTVTAHYTSATQYAIDDANATYLSVYPQTLPTGTQLTVAASTEGYTINKVITLGQDIEILPGKITTLRIGIADEHITAAAAGMLLPFFDDFTDLKGTSAYDPTIRENSNGEKLYSAAEYTYQYNQPSGLRVSTSSHGYLTTVDLDLSQEFTVIVKARAWAGDNTSLKVTAGDASQTTEAQMTETFETYAFAFPAQTSKTKIRIEPEGERMIISEINIVYGNTLPPILKITSPSSVSADPAGEQITVDYTVINPVEGETIAATATSGDAPATWIHDFDTTTDGKVLFTVDANDGDVRTATVTFTYATAPAQTITISQLSSTPIENGYVEVTSTEEITEGEYILIGVYENTPYYLPNTDVKNSQPVSAALPSGVSLIGNVITNPTADMTWTFTASGNGFTVTSTADPTIGMGGNNDSRGFRINADNLSCVWTFEKVTSTLNWNIYNTNATRYLSVYTATNWRLYSTAGQNNNGSFRLFKKQ